MRTRVFKDKDAKDALLFLRKKGFTYEALASIFNVDHSSIYFHCKSIHPEHTIAFGINDVVHLFSINTLDLVHLFPIEVKGKRSYSDYIAQEKSKRLFRLISKL